jgi:hypothetical protein
MVTLVQLLPTKMSALLETEAQKANLREAYGHLRALVLTLEPRRNPPDIFRIVQNRPF